MRGKRFFSREEINEIYDWYELDIGYYIDPETNTLNGDLTGKHKGRGRKITYFKHVYFMASGQKSKADYSREELDDFIDQIKLEIRFFQSVGNFDFSLHEKVIRFLQAW